MTRLNKTQAVSTARMYRHFAVVTIVVTALIALFADGEKREAVAATAMPKPDAIELAAQGKDTNQIKVGSRNAASGEFGGDSDGGSSDGGSSGGGWSGGSAISDDLSDLASNARGVAGLGSSLTQLPGPPEGMSAEDWASRQVRRQKNLQDTQASKADITDLIAQSRMRSGSGSDLSGNAE